MLPASFQDFFITCVGASASFIGLLFVAISVVLSRTDNTRQLEFTDRRLAESAFMSLVNIFFISLQAIVPNGNLGILAILFAVFGLRSSLRIFSNGNQRDVRNIIWFLSSSFIYVLQIVYAARLINNPADINNLYGITVLIFLHFATSLLRAWELTGVRRRA